VLIIPWLLRQGMHWTQPSVSQTALCDEVENVAARLVCLTRKIVKKVGELLDHGIVIGGIVACNTEDLWGSVSLRST
jgi:hypothetical protein